MKGVKAIIAGTVYTLAQAIRNGVILIEDHRIAKVGSRDQVKIPAGATAIDAGPTRAVHCFNAMRPLMHRDAGIIGAMLTDDRVSAELICDGIHVEPAAIRPPLRSKGIECLILVSDSLSGAGMPDGNYRLGNFTMHVAGGVCQRPAGRRRPGNP